jgi:hypothetical protein
MDIVPKDSMEPEDNSYLSERAMFAHQLDKIRPIDRKSLVGKKARGLAALHDTFELIGGVPRLAIHADENPTEFYSLYFRYTQSQDKTINHNIRILAPTIPPTALDGDITDIEFEEVRTTDGDTSQNDTAGN